MKTFIKAILFIFLFMFLVSGVFTVLGAALSFTFGVLGGVLSFVWKVVSNPVVLVLIIIYLAYKLNKTSPSK